MLNKTGQENILICDDSITNTMMLEAFLSDEGYRHVTALNRSEQVAPMMRSNDYQLLLLDIEMPVMTGFEVMKQLYDEHIVDQSFPIIIMTGRQDAATRNRALVNGAIDFVNKPFDHTEVLLRIRNALRSYAAYCEKRELSQQLEQLVAERNQQLTLTTDLLLAKLATAGELKDYGDKQHTRRVGMYARLLAELNMLPETICLMIEKAAPLHDLGKITIADNILFKQGALDTEEKAQMQRHTLIGAELLSGHDSPLIQMASLIALSHHEHWDGSGYPQGLAREVIPIEGRITALCDSFDALTTSRHHREAMTVEQAADTIRQHSGRKFDPKLTTLFIDSLTLFAEIKRQYSDTTRGANGFAPNN